MLFMESVAKVYFLAYFKIASNFTNFFIIIFLPPIFIYYVNFILYNLTFIKCD